jgi:hypothetical protein
LTVLSFLVIASRIQKLELITWQDDALVGKMTRSSVPALLVGLNPDCHEREAAHPA